MIPDTLLQPLRTALRRAGDRTPVRHVERVSGGHTNQAVRVYTTHGSYLLKWHGAHLPGFFAAEARGLALLHRLGARVPVILDTADGSGQTPGYMLQVWVETADAEGTHLGARLGAAMARLHWSSAPTQGYGLDHDNYLGADPQPNRWRADWVTFYREQRLLPQVALAARKKLLPLERQRQLRRISERLEDWLGGVERRPSLLHGDLWENNVLCASDGAPVLIDPAVYYGDREWDLACTFAWGGFPAEFYAAYEEVWPLAPGFADRREIYLIGYLLSWLNAGVDCGPKLDAILRRYAGGAGRS